jgi:endonuclease/exonuclease/phosphatase (EEP) superfamily protein YafD
MGFKDIFEAHLFVGEVCLKEEIKSFLILTSSLVFIFFFIWFCLSFFTHGCFAWVNILNMFAFYIFIFLIPFGLIGIFHRIRLLQIASLVALALFVLTFGKLFVPKPRPVSSSANILQVMTYNMLVYTPEIHAAADVIREEDADVVFIQETSFLMAEMLESEMKEIYPYQIHQPSDIPVGLSVISKYPFEVINYDLGDSWVGEPILLDIDWHGQIIHLVNFHMDPTSLGVIATPNRSHEVAEMRKEHAGRLVQFLQKTPGPAILAGDANDVFLNDPYIHLTSAGLQDAWAEGGFGLGHTFPGNKSPGTSRLHINGFYIPEWLVRIDYIFVTSHWEVLSTHLAGSDGYSDHRAVVTNLHFR